MEKTEAKKKYTQEKLRKMESKKQPKYSEETKFSHNYFFVVTLLGEGYSAEEIMSLCRLHGQVEMVFKRLKSILNNVAILTAVFSIMIYRVG